jgi:hypothetical protein
LAIFGEHIVVQVSLVSLKFVSLPAIVRSCRVEAIGEVIATLVVGSQGGGQETTPTLSSVEARFVFRIRRSIYLFPRFGPQPIALPFIAALFCVSLS